MKLNIFASEDEVLSSLAEHFISIASQSIAKHSRFSVSLSGGTSPKKLYGLLASHAFKNRVDWDNVYFFFGDERYVPQTDPASNYLMVKTALFTPLGIKDSHIFPVNTSLSPKEAARQYLEDIHCFFIGSELQFDLVLLGLGDNSHTASLFPHTPVLHENTASVKEVFLENDQKYRITFTAPLINLAQNISFLVYGKGKAEAVYNILEGERNIDEFPAQLIAPTHGEVQWFLDEEAASEINKK